MAVPIQPNITPSQTHRSAAHNAAHTGVAGNQVREQGATEAESATRPAEQSELGATRDTEGRTFVKLEDGGRLALADSGLELRESDGGTAVSLPTGHQIIHGKDGKPSVIGPDGQMMKAEAFVDEEGRTTGYAFDDVTGNRVSVDLDDLSFAVQNPCRTLTQHVDAAGGQFIESVTVQRHPVRKTIQNHVQQVYIDPQGTVHDLSAESPEASSLNFSNTGMHYSTGRGEGHSAQLPLPINRPLRSAAAAAAEAAPPVRSQPEPSPSPAQTRPQPSSSPSPPARSYPPMDNQAAPAVLKAVEPAMEPVEGSLVETPSGVFRQVQPDGTLVIQLANGVSVMDGPSGLLAVEPKGQGRVPVEKTMRQREGGLPPEAQYRFNDAEGNRYTLFGESLDFVVESPPDPRIGGQRRIGQAVMPQGYIFTTIRGDQGSYRFETAPNGYVKTSPGLRLGMDPRTKQPDRVFLPEQNLPMLPLPYPTPEHHALAEMTPAPPNLPVSGVVPEAFGLAPGNNPGMPPQVPPQAGGQYPPMPSGPLGYPSGNFGQAPTGAPPGPPPPPGGTMAGYPGQQQAQVKPGVWGKIKDFFHNLGGGDGGPPGSGYQSDPSFCQHMRGYPRQHHRSPMDTMMKTMMVTNIASTAVWGLSMLSMMNPMRWGMFYSPFMF